MTAVNWRFPKVGLHTCSGTAAGRPGPLRRIGAPIVEGAKAQRHAVTRGTGGGLAWPALLRRLNRLDPGYLC
ncbi:MAG: hypothetical protein U1F17_12905 [Burkholderiaceae bacterium]